MPTNLCSSVAGYRFFDHNPAPLRVIADCCADMHTFLNAHPENVVSVHCKAGKGRTGLIISAYLVHAGIAPHTTAALKLFGDVRTHDGKGVTIPSQMRYVHYYEAALRKGGGDPYHALSLPAIPRLIPGSSSSAGALGTGFGPVTFTLTHIRLHTVPNFDVTGGCDPYFDVRLGDGKTQIFNWSDAHNKKVKNYRKGKFIDFDCKPFNIRVRGDVKVSRRV
jgi:phosphatidylinositol-3,4,5-trisphosphate 3-phosphatase/dual-specificity protein phosphatase PTEN